MPAQVSQSLTHDLILKEIDAGIPKLSKSILSQVSRMIEPERHPDLSPHVWVFWGKSYPQIFNGIGRCVQFLKIQDQAMWPGASRPMHVYEGYKHTLRDFLDLPEDGSIAFVHQAHRLRGKFTEEYFKGFKKLFECKYRRNQIVFLSEGPFFRQLPEMESVKITDGKVDVGWFWPPDEPGQIETTISYDPNVDPRDVEATFEVEWQKVLAANPERLQHVLNDPDKRADFKATMLKDLREETENIARGRKPRTPHPIRMHF